MLGKNKKRKKQTKSKLFILKESPYTRRQSVEDANKFET